MFLYKVTVFSLNLKTRRWFLLKKKILAFDDDISFLFGLKWCLKEDYEIKICETQEEVKKSLKKFKPDVLILDLYLNPFMYDYSYSKKILKIAKEKNHIKVIISTVEKNKAIKEEMLKAGADDYLNKPFTYNDLKRSINQACKEVH